MENEESKVEMTTEPSIESRFGFQKDKKLLSPFFVKLCVGGTILSITIIMLLHSPDRTETTDRASTVKTPESSDLNNDTSRVNLDSYSAADENEKLKQKNQKRNVTIVKLPGLQKIDRKRTTPIPPGSMVRASLITGASNGTVRAQVKESLQVQGETVIPEGATLFGSGQSTEERLFIKFTKLILKDGSSETIQAEAVDLEDKIAGLKGSKVGRYAIKYGAAIGLNFVGGMAEGLQDRDIVGQQVVTRPDAKNALLSGTSKATLEMANETMTGLRNQAPVIEVEAGREILVIVE